MGAGGHSLTSKSLTAPRRDAAPKGVRHCATRAPEGRNVVPEIVDAVTSFGSYPGKQVDWSLEALLGILQENGVDRALSLSLKGVYYDFEEGNDETLAVSREHPVIVPVATIDPRRHLGCIDEVGRRAEQGFRVFRFFPTEQGWPWDFLPFRNLLRELAKYDVRLMLPVAGNGAITALFDPLEAHAPGVRTLLTGVTYSNLAELLAALEATDRLYTDVHMMDSPNALELIADEVGVERIIFGSNSPEREFRSALNVVTYASLSEADKRKVLAKNVEAFLA
ncbi:MAG: amidohydrolase family protein [Armatimonadota bacterium]